MNKDRLIKEINSLKKKHNAIILAHYYTLPEVQDIADFIGDSLALSQKAADTSADMILFAGVNFMAETAKILSPQKIVLSPDMEAGCSLADSCDAQAFSKFIQQHPNHTVISYVNTSVEVKALTDIVCTSSNAVQVVNSVPKERGIIFGPDRNLGRYVISQTGRDNILVWDGACHVHEEFSANGIKELKTQHPKAKVLTHPECKKEVIDISDFVGSTAAILNFAKDDKNGKEFIIVTESGILHKLKQECPSKTFYPAPVVNNDDNRNCHCNECPFMKLVSLEKIYDSLKNQTTQINIEESIRAKAELSIRRMLSL
ncbi:MAG: quinolinate synthase NadA [Rikenellaceae bacterium]